MSITTPDPNTALVVIDLQKGIAALPLVHPIADVVARARELLAAFRARGLPVVLMNVTGVAPRRTERPPRTEPWPADMRPEAHAYSIASVFPRLGETGTTRDVLAKLEARE